MKLYIWQGQGVLQDYSSGMICAIAKDLEEALQAIEKTCEHCMSSFPNHKPSEVIDLKGCRKIKAKAWLVHGGG